VSVEKHNAHRSKKKGIRLPAVSQLQGSPHSHRDHERLKHSTNQLREVYEIEDAWLLFRQRYSLSMLHSWHSIPHSSSGGEVGDREVPERGRRCHAVVEVTRSARGTIRWIACIISTGPHDPKALVIHV